jgi:UDP-N-acetylmuramoyl-L-alanyl-D-glutamate--2,6-diaminopimelate ligase
MRQSNINNRLEELISVISCETIGDISKLEINKIEYDSRLVRKNDLFCCISGTFLDGHEYAQAAVDAGACAVLCERRLPHIQVPQIIVENSRIAMAKLAAEYYNHPADGMVIVGITGTNGKTTTSYMLKAIAEQAGKKVGLIGTIKNLIGDEVLATSRTTPESVELQAILRKMNDAGVDIVVMEVSSHSLDQERVHGIVFDVAVFTNLTQDHLDYHKTFDNYFAAKKKLFNSCINACFNTDDSYADAMMEGVTCPVTTFGITRNADIYAKNIDIKTTGVDFTLNRGKESIDINVPIPGLFSVMNALSAASAAFALGYSIEHIRAGLENMSPVAGRLESLPTHGRDFMVILDYAHSPDALENLLNTIRGFAQGRIVTLFGCGGDRDKGKRPIMGEIAGRLSDFLIVTSDNPRTENPTSIINMILEGVEKTGCEYVVIENRYEAIEYALKNAKRNDCIVLAGKGHESYQEINGEKKVFDEKQIVESILSKMQD